MKIYSIGQLSPEEKSDILEKHRTLYDGYKTMQPKVSNTQDLYTQDFANDKNGITVSNKGNVKKYTNIGINEQESKEMCSECGGMMKEGECSECGWTGDMGEQTKQVEDLKHVEDLHGKFDYIEGEETKEQLGYQGNPYGDEKPAYDFISGGPGKAFREQWDEDEYMTSAFDDEDDFELDNPEDSPIDFVSDEDEMSLGDDKLGNLDMGPDDAFSDEDVDEQGWEEVDNDFRESFVNQKNLVLEMMNRMKRF